jgi:hypothetical protein
LSSALIAGKSAISGWALTDGLALVTIWQRRIRMSTIRRTIIIGVLLLGLLSLNTPAFAGNLVPMGMFDADGCDGLKINLYLYAKDTQTMHTLKENCNNIDNFGALSLDESFYVHAQEPEADPIFASLFNIDTQQTTEIIPAGGIKGACAGMKYDNAIVFVGTDGTLKQMDGDGSNAVTLATPQSPYSFGFFVISPDQNKLAVTETRTDCADYHHCNFQRLVLIDLPTMTRQVVTEAYLGDWNFLTWRPNSDGFYYVYHVFDSETERTHHTISCEISCTGQVTTVDLTGSDIGDTISANIALYTKTDNLLLSLGDKGLYDANTGAKITTIDTVPDLLGAPKLFGSDDQGIYFSEVDGSDMIAIEDGDVNTDGRIDGVDLALVAADFGNCGSGCVADMDADKDVDGNELVILASGMGSQPQPCVD